MKSYYQYNALCDITFRSPLSKGYSIIVNTLSLKIEFLHPKFHSNLPLYTISITVYTIRESKIASF